VNTALAPVIPLVVRTAHVHQAAVFRAPRTGSVAAAALVIRIEGKNRDPARYAQQMVNLAGGHAREFPEVTTAESPQAASMMGA
jgi:hypothetical protein